MLRRIFGVIDTVFTFFEEWVLFIATMAALLSLFVNVILRYGFDSGFAWSEELVREVIIVTTFIGCSMAIKMRAMIKIDALVQLVPPLKTFCLFFNHLATLVFSVMMIYYGWLMAALMVQTYQKTIIMEIPLVYLYAILPVWGVLTFIRVVMVMYQDVKDLQEKHAAA